MDILVNISASPYTLNKRAVRQKILETISYDPTARDLSVEIAKAKATGAEALLVVSRLNDAILLTREMVKQRWTPMAIMSMGPGWYEDQYLKTLNKLSDGPLSFAPWYDPNKKLSKQLDAALAGRVHETPTGIADQRRARGQLEQLAGVLHDGVRVDRALSKVGRHLAVAVKRSNSPFIGVLLA